MGIESLLIASIAVAAAGTATSVVASAQQGSANRKLAAYQNAQQAAAYAKSVAVNQAQSNVTAMERRRQLQARYDAFKGATAVSAAERGVADSRSSTALTSSLGIMAARESAKISMENALNQQSFAASNTPMWQVGQSTNPFLSGVQGGLQGLGLGLSMASSYSQLQSANQIANVGGNAGYGSLNTSGLQTNMNPPNIANIPMNPYGL